MYESRRSKKIFVRKNQFSSCVFYHSFKHISLHGLVERCFACECASSKRMFSQKRQLIWCALVKKLSTAFLAAIFRRVNKRLAYILHNISYMVHLAFQISRLETYILHPTSYILHLTTYMLPITS